MASDEEVAAYQSWWSKLFPVSVARKRHSAIENGDQQDTPAPSKRIQWDDGSTSRQRKSKRHQVNEPAQGSDSEAESAPRRRLRRKVASGRVQLPLFEWRREPVLTPEAGSGPVPDEALYGSPTPPILQPLRQRPLPFFQQADSPNRYFVCLPHDLVLKANDAVAVNMEISLKLPLYSTLVIKPFHAVRAKPVDSNGLMVPFGATAQVPLGGAAATTPLGATSPVLCTAQTVHVLMDEWTPLVLILNNQTNRDLRVSAGEIIARLGVVTFHQPVENTSRGL